MEDIKEKTADEMEDEEVIEWLENQLRTDDEEKVLQLIKKYQREIEKYKQAILNFSIELLGDDK